MHGIETSVYFMLAMVLFVVPGGLLLLVWRSYRGARAARLAGEAFRPQGKLRWEAGEERAR
jgi:hypothetical protein